jgi:hypothetical protein
MKLSTKIDLLVYSLIACFFAGIGLAYFDDPKWLLLTAVALIVFYAGG